MLIIMEQTVGRRSSLQRSLGMTHTACQIGAECIDCDLPVITTAQFGDDPCCMPDRRLINGLRIISPLDS